MTRTGGRVVKLAGVTITKIPFEKLSYFWKGAVRQGTQRNRLHTLLYCVDRLDAMVPPVSLLSLTLFLTTPLFCRRDCCKWSVHCSGGRSFLLAFLDGAASRRVQASLFTTSRVWRWILQGVYPVDQLSSAFMHQSVGCLPSSPKVPLFPWCIGFWLSPGGG
jgi:hypothetical protein